MPGRSKSAAAAMVDCVLPLDIMFSILTRLPVESILRFKSVCKPWRDLFANPDFIKLHHAQFSSHPQNHSFMIYSVSKPGGADHHTMSLFRIESNDEKSTKLDHPYPQIFNEMDFVGSCNGLICLAMPPYGQYIIIWNPALPEMKFGDNESVSLGFCYGQEAGDFMVVRIGCLDAGEKFRPGVEVYSTHSDSWKVIETDLMFRILSTKCNAVVGGSPHWIVKVDDESHKSHIVWFDVKRMTLKIVPSLDVELEMRGALLPLMDWNGSLAVMGCSVSKETVGFGAIHVVVFDKDKKNMD